MSEVSLTGWMKALIAYVRSGEPDLTNRQMALLMLVYLTPGPHTVSVTVLYKENTSASSDPISVTAGAGKRRAVRH